MTMFIHALNTSLRAYLQNYMVRQYMFVSVAFMLLAYFSAWLGFDFAQVLGTAIGPAIFGLGGGGGGSGDGGVNTNLGNNWSDEDAADIASINKSIGVDVTATANNVNGWSYTADYGYGVTATWSSSNPTGSTPFLKTWNGFRFEHENDFLFGKPQTVFNTYEQGIAAYQAGIGGDTYVLNNHVVAEDGKLKFEIHEVEPEESYIDSFTLSVLDLQASEHVVANGNLREFHVFDANKTNTISEQQVAYVPAGKQQFKEATLAYNELGAEPAAHEVVMQTGDELVIKVSRSQVNKLKNEDLFILVDSYYRDWTLGDEVPFTRLEQFSIQTAALGRTVATTAAGVAVIAAGLMGLQNSTTYTDDVVSRALSVPHAAFVKTAHADSPHGGGSYSGTTNYRSLVVAAQIGNENVHLETLFPRFVQASQEVIKVPRELFAKLSDEHLIIRIQATKKHIVRAAFVFAGVARQPKMQPLTLERAYHVREQQDYATALQKQDGNFLKTEPADKVELTFVAPAPAVAGTVRQYVLQAHGFYTKMSEATKAKLGTSWYKKLSTDDRRLLQTFRKTK